MKIKVLDDALITKIAAGEVIERPASVVKELLENAIDAGADEIAIMLREGGKSFISVTDDGVGMGEEDAKVACVRHSTSKIAQEADLFDISTLGFRGEALASIASVSNMVLTTSDSDLGDGTRIIYEDGNLLGIEKVASKRGTKIEVKNLFGNIPARKKYLKNMQYELKLIIDIVTRYALLFPDKHFSLMHNDKVVMTVPAVSDPLMNLSYVYGRKTAGNMIRIEADSDLIKIEGFIGKPQISRSNKVDQTLFVNGRYVKNKVISDAINEAYHTLMMQHRYPLVVLNILIPTKMIDVNVHPAKLEIRLSHEKEIYKAVYDSIRCELRQNDLISETEAKDYETKLVSGPVRQVHQEKKKYSIVEDSQQTLSDPAIDYINKKGTYEAGSDNTDTLSVNTKKLPSMRILGVIAKTYIIAESVGSMLIIDQHAAAERILYEKFMADHFDGSIKKQALLEPIVIEASAKRSLVIKENLETLNALGFSVEEFGRDSFLLRSMPSIFGTQSQKIIFDDLIDELTDSTQKKIDKIKEERIIRMSCRAAIKAGDIIGIDEIKDYIRKLDSKEVPYTCPHGRPIIVRFTNYELEKMFKRVV